MVSSVTLGNYFSTGGRTVFGGTGGSGLDTQSIITALVNAKSIPATQAQDKIKANATQASALSEFQTLLSRLKDAANFLRNPPGINSQADNIFKFTKATVTSNTSVSGNTYITVSTSPGAQPQNYTIDEISSLARSAKQVTAAFAVASADTAVVKTSPAAATPPNAGEFKAGTFTFKGVSITLNDGDTLNNIATKFNSVSETTGVTANIIKVDSSHYQLSFVATDSGTAYDFDFNSGDLVDADDVFGEVPVTNVQSASDAVFTIDGVEITRSSNSISDAISGVTFTLFATTPAATELSVDIKQDESLIKDGVVNFVNVYNEFRAFVAKQTEVDDNGSFTAGAILASNATFRQIVNDVSTQVTGIASRMVSAGTGATLAKSAITFTDLPKTADSPLVRNVLAVDEGTLTSIISTDPDEVRRAFSFDLISDSPYLQVYSRTNALAVSEFVLNANPYATQTTQTLTVADADTAFVSSNPSAGQLKAGTITVNGQAITLADGDTLNQVIAKFAAVESTTGLAASLSVVEAGKYKITFTSTATTGNNNFNLRSVALDPTGVFGRVTVTSAGSYSATYTNGSSSDTVSLTPSLTPFSRTQSTGPLTLSDPALGANSPIAFDAPAAGQLGAGSFNFKDQAITLDDGDTLNEVVQKINAVSSSTGVRAFVATNAAGNYILSFTSVNSDAENDFDLTNTRMSSLDDTSGVFDNTGAFATTERKDSMTLSAPSDSKLSGLVLIYAESAAVSTNVTVTQGFADRIYNSVSGAIAQNTGTIAVELNSIKTRDDRLNVQIAQINEQVERFRQQLLDKFAALEQAIARVNNLLQSITANNDARNNN